MSFGATVETTSLQNPRSRKASSKNLCSAQAVIELKYVKMSMTDWSFYMKAWKKLPRSRQPRQLCGAGTSFFVTDEIREMAVEEVE